MKLRNMLEYDSTPMFRIELIFNAHEFHNTKNMTQHFGDGPFVLDGMFTEANWQDFFYQVIGCGQIRVSGMTNTFSFSFSNAAEYACLMHTVFSMVNVK